MIYWAWSQQVDGTERGTKTEEEIEKGGRIGIETETETERGTGIETEGETGTVTIETRGTEVSTQKFHFPKKSQLLFLVFRSITLT